MSFIPKITQAGMQAALDAFSMDQKLGISHIGWGSGAYNPTGYEVSMTNEIERSPIASGTVFGNQIRFSAIWDDDNAVGVITEIGIYAGTTLFAVWSNAEAEPIGYKTEQVDFVSYYDFILVGIPENTITIVEDGGQSALLAALGSHTNDDDAHPFYAKRSRRVFAGNSSGDDENWMVSISSLSMDFFDSYSDGQCFIFRSHQNNIDNVSLRVNDLAYLPIKISGSLISGGVLISGQYYEVMVVNGGTELELISSANMPYVISALSGKEPSIAAGTIAQYWRGDKTWQTLNKSSVGLGSVDNTSDADKPISTAQQSALNLKADKSAINFSRVPQCILSGPVGYDGYSNHIKIYAGGSLSGASVSTNPVGDGHTPIAISIANGYDEFGDADNIFRTLESGYIPILNMKARATNYVYFEDGFNVGHTDIAPQYVNSLSEIKIEACLLHFDNSTYLLADEYALYVNKSPWEGDGVISTSVSVKKFGARSLELAGSGFIENVNFPQLGARSEWTVDFWIRRESVGSEQAIFMAGDHSSIYGSVVIRFDAATNNIVVQLSTTGSSYDITDTVVSGSTVTNDGLFHHVELNYSTVFGSSAYRLFLDGVQVWSLTSSDKVGNTHHARVGATLLGFLYLTGYIDEFRVSNQARHTSGFTPELSAYVKDESWDVFNIDEMKMRSYGFGNGDAVGRLYIGEVITNALGIQSVVSYSHAGRFISAYENMPAPSGVISVAHNLGINPNKAVYKIRCKIAENGYSFGDVIDGPIGASNGTVITPQAAFSDRLNVGMRASTSNSGVVVNKSTGAISAIDEDRWEIQFTCERGW